jgi:hypothetical protein
MVSGFNCVSFGFIVRILIAGPPKTGNVWIKHILAGVYDLKMLDDVPGGSASQFREFVEQNKFPNGTIFHQHFHPEPALFDAMNGNSPYLVTTIRNPYDTFVSLYYFAQRHPQAFADEAHPVHMLVGKPIEHPDVSAYLANQYRGNLLLAEAWVKCGRSFVVRYEDLLKDPYNTVDLLTLQMEKVSPRRIRKYVDECSAKKLKKRGGYWDVHIRTATSGDWEKVLNQEHLRVLREHHSDLIKSTGYEVM